MSVVGGQPKKKKKTTKKRKSQFQYKAKHFERTFNL